MLAHLRGYKCSGRVSGVSTARAQLLVLPRASRASDPAGSRPGCAGELAEAAGQAGGFGRGTGDRAAMADGRVWVFWGHMNKAVRPKPARLTVKTPCHSPFGCERYFS